MTEIVLNDSNFQEEVINSKTPIVVDFWASWCGPCKMLSPIIAEIAEEYKDRIKVGKLNVDEAPVTAMKYRIASIPTVKLFKNGEVSKTAVGFMSKSQLIAELGI